MRRFFHSNQAAILYLVSLFIGAVIPLGKITQELTFSNVYTLHVRGDYLLHSLLYIPLPIILMMSRTGRKVRWIGVFVFTITIVILFETVQILIPFRGFNINDLLANGVGVFLGFLIFILVRKRIYKITASVE